MKSITLTLCQEMSQMELGEEFERAWMKTVAILITYCKLFIVISN
jgi:hypothetical protein